MSKQAHLSFSTSETINEHVMPALAVLCVQWITSAFELNLLYPPVW